MGQRQSSYSRGTPTAKGGLRVAHFKDPETSVVHVYQVGENVILTGEAKRHADSQGFVGVAKVAALTHDKNGRPVVDLVLFKEGKPNAEGGVGTPMARLPVWVEGNILPLPIFVREVKISDLEHDAGEAVCSRLDFSNPWKCASCDPTGALFDWSQERDAIMAALTTVQGPPGSVRHSMFTCPLVISRVGKPVRFSDEKCSTVIITTKQDQASHTNRYSLTATPEIVAFKVGLLKAYGLPVTATYLNSIEWSSIPAFQEWKIKYPPRQLPECYGLDNILLSEKVKGLLERGYVMTNMNNVV